MGILKEERVRSVGTMIVHLKVGAAISTNVKLCETLDGFYNAMQMNLNGIVSKNGMHRAYDLFELEKCYPHGQKKWINVWKCFNRKRGHVVAKIWEESNV